MRKLSILSLLVLTSLFSQAQTLSGVLYDSSLGLDFWKLDEKTGLYTHSKNVQLNPLSSINISNIYCYDSKYGNLYVILNNANCLLKIKKISNSYVKKQLKQYSIPTYSKLSEEDITAKSNALNRRYELLNDSITQRRKIEKRQKAIDDSIRIANESKIHMKFMGIEMNCAVDIAMLDLEKKGWQTILANNEVHETTPDFSKVATTNEGYIMSGKFIDRNALVTLHATPKTNLFYRANIFFNEHTSWYSLKSEFLEVVKYYKAKYKSISSSRTFIDPYFEGDGYELQGVSMDKCFYYESFEAEGGKISIEISDMKRVQIRYEDKNNAKKNEQETIAINLDEI